MVKAKGRRLMAEMNVVPYIDVSLVLLVIFMITAPLLTQGFTVDLPNEPADPLDISLLQDNEPFVISIDSAGLLYTNVGDDPELPVDAETLQARIRSVLRRNPDTPVFFKVDEGASYGQFVRGQSLARQAGARSVIQLVDLPGTESE